MDPFHARLLEVTLPALAPFGFALAGGYAVQAHGYVQRPSEDVDLFTTMAAERDFPAAVRIAVAVLEQVGLEVDVQREGPTFARLRVTDPPTARSGRVELGIDWRAYPPTNLTIGPVLHKDDAVANKVCALYARGEVRDYIDVDGILRSGDYTLADLLHLAVEHDPGFDPRIFADSLRAVQRFADSAFGPYDLGTEEVAKLRERVVSWADQIANGDFE